MLTVEQIDDLLQERAQGSKEMHDFARAIEALVRAECVPQWQPIETAPKDGTNVLLVNRAGNMGAGLWMNSILGCGWFLRGGSFRPDAFFNEPYGPTHWMPLPAAPDITAPQGEQQ